MKKVIVIVGILVLVGIVVAIWTRQEKAQSVMCTLEAKLCPDGSSVGRVPPRCEFAPCPQTSMNTSSTKSNENEKISGKRLVYFRSFKQDGPAGEVMVDPIEMFGGEEAIQAAMEDTKCTRDNIYTCAPSLNNAFYIRNTSTSTQKLFVSVVTEVYLISEKDGVNLEKVGIFDFKKKYDAGGSIYLNAPFWITVENGNKITKIEQQYIP